MPTSRKMVGYLFALIIVARFTQTNEFIFAKHSSFVIKSNTVGIEFIRSCVCVCVCVCVCADEELLDEVEEVLTDPEEPAEEPPPPVVQEEVAKEEEKM